MINMFCYYFKNEKKRGKDSARERVFVIILLYIIVIYFKIIVFNAKIIIFINIFIEMYHSFIQ